MKILIAIAVIGLGISAQAQTWQTNTISVVMLKEDVDQLKQAWMYKNFALTNAGQPGITFKAMVEDHVANTLTSDARGFAQQQEATTIDKFRTLSDADKIKIMKMVNNPATIP